MPNFGSTPKLDFHVFKMHIKGRTSPSTSVIRGKGLKKINNGRILSLALSFKVSNCIWGKHQLLPLVWLGDLRLWLYNIAWEKQDLGTLLIMARELVGLPMLWKCVLMDWAVRGEISVEKRQVFCHYYCLEGEIYTNGTLVAFFLTPPGFFACSFYSDYKFWHFKYHL